MNQSHLDMDDMGEWAESHPITQRAHRALPLPEAHYTAPQGRPEQGWPVRRCSPEMACWAPDDDQTDSADMDVALWLFKGFVVVLLALFCAWCIANYLAISQVDDSNCISTQKGGSVEFVCKLEPGKPAVMRWGSK